MEAMGSLEPSVRTDVVPLLADRQASIALVAQLGFRLGVCAAENAKVDEGLGRREADQYLRADIRVWVCGGGVWGGVARREKCVQTAANDVTGGTCGGSPPHSQDHAY